MNMKYTLIGIIVIAMLTLTACQQQSENTINVDGMSEISVEPDEAEVWAGISVVKNSAEEAQSEVNEVINAMIDGLRYKGIKEEDIETERLNLYEEYSWEEGKRTSIGWRASQTLKISTDDLTKVGEIVDISVKNGANQLNNINFKLSKEKESEFKKQALAEATKNAKEKAETIAESLDARLGKIKTVSESNFGYRPYMYEMAKAASSDMEIVEEAAAVMPSDVSVTANINIVYYIK